MMYDYQNVITWTRTNTGWKHRYINNPDFALSYLKLQIHNSLDLGWTPDKIVVVTNFDFEHMGVKANRYDVVRGWSAFANKLMCVSEMIDRGVINKNLWYHDADCYQLVPFEFPIKSGIGFTYHAPRRRKLQGGSSFYAKDSLHLPKVISTGMNLFKARSEETFFEALFLNRPDWKQKKLEKYRRSQTHLDYINSYFCNLKPILTVLDWRYNLFRVRDFKFKYRSATKPIYAVHFHVEYPSAVDCFVKGLNRHKIKIVDERLLSLFFKYNMLDKMEVNHVDAQAKRIPDC